MNQEGYEGTMGHQHFMSIGDTALLVVDVQEKLVPKIHQNQDLVRNIEFLIKVSKLLEVPALGVEQYPKGLGHTVEPIRSMFEHFGEKKAFSAVREGLVLEKLEVDARIKVIVVGIETHICVQQTVLDLLNRGFHVFVPVDGVSSRYVNDTEVALRRMENAGAILTTVEACAFELMGTADHPAFREISSLVVERSKFLNPQF
jgi:nicotinamidase-related amidase